MWKTAAATGSRWLKKDKGSQLHHISSALDSVSSVVVVRGPSSKTISATSVQGLFAARPAVPHTLAGSQGGFLTMRSSTILVAVAMLALVGRLPPSLLCL